MKLNENFISHNSDGENILIDVTGEKFAGLVRSNATAAFIVECLAEETDADKIAAKMMSAFEGADEKSVKEDIAMVTEKLRKIGALDE